VTRASTLFGAASLSALSVLATCASSPSSDSKPSAKPSVEPPRPAPSLVKPEPGGAGAKRADVVVAAQASDANPPQVGEPDGDAAHRVAGWIAGEPLAFEEILSEWHAISPRDVFYVVEKLVSGRLAVAEAGRLGIRLVPEVVEAEYQAQVARFRADAANEAPGLDVEEFIRQALDVEPELHWQHIRDGVIRQMLAERAVRCFAFERENAAVRLIVVATEAEAQKLADEIAAGADFAELAVQHSIDESGRDGGLVPFLVRQESSPLARAAFRAKVGEVAGPILATGHFFLVKVEKRRAAIEGTWPEMRETVEASLRDVPVAEAEFLHWKLEMERRYSIDLGPLMEAVGTPRAPKPAEGTAERRNP